MKYDRVTAPLPFDPEGKIKPADLDYASRRGTEVHRAVEYYERGKLDPDSVGEVVGPYFEGWKKFKVDTDWETSLCEFEVESELYRLKGRPDLLGYLDRLPSILDLKSGKPSIPNTWPLQLAAYNKLAIDMIMKGQLGFDIGKARKLQRVVVQLPGDGSYKLHSGPKGKGCNCCDFSESDFAIYNSYLTIYRFEGKGNK